MREAGIIITDLSYNYFKAFPLILMDMSMPRMNGVEATRELRRRGSQSCIIMISANIMDEHRQSTLTKMSN